MFNNTNIVFFFTEDLSKCLVVGSVTLDFYLYSYCNKRTSRVSCSRNCTYTFFFETSVKCCVYNSDRNPTMWNIYLKKILTLVKRWYIILSSLSWLRKMKSEKACSTKRVDFWFQVPSKVYDIINRVRGNSIISIFDALALGRRQKLSIISWHLRLSSMPTFKQWFSPEFTCPSTPVKKLPTPIRSFFQNARINRNPISSQLEKWHTFPGWFYILFFNSDISLLTGVE